MKKLEKFYNETGPERCGYIRKGGKVIEVTNHCNEPEEGFEFGADDILSMLNEGIATWHTHPGQSSNLSAQDYEGFLNFPDLKHYIVGNDGVRCYHVEDGLILQHEV